MLLTESRHVLNLVHPLISQTEEAMDEDISREPGAALSLPPPNSGSVVQDDNLPSLVAAYQLHVLQTCIPLATDGIVEVRFPTKPSTWDLPRPLVRPYWWKSVVVVSSVASTLVRVTMLCSFHKCLSDRGEMRILPFTVVSVSYPCLGLEVSAYKPNSERGSVLGPSGEILSLVRSSRWRRCTRAGRCFNR